MNTIETKTIFVKGFEIAYYQTGNDDIPLIFLHGGGTDSAMLSWEEVLRLWTDNRRLIAIDLPNYGASQSVDNVHSVDFYCEFLLEFLQKINFEKIHICGLSMGGAIALQMTLQHPNIIEKMILVAPWGITPEIPWKKFGKWLASSNINKWIYQWMKYHFVAKWAISFSLFGDKNKISDSLVKSVQKASLQEKSINAFQSFQLDEIYNPKREKFLLKNLPNIQRPTLLIQGDKDPGIKKEYAVAAAKIIPKAQLIIFENHKHWLQKESPKRFIKAVQDFLQNND